ncbi:MAG: hypothetical protein A2V85_18430 [Chloroflexi bacterium RBG_16_72_14]|nr:MAG: hypothetical protein A2V85_18430 [Chloroflexi bacterium RBG_16_72_14]
MNVRHDSAGPLDEQAGAGARVHHPEPADGPAPEAAPPLVHGTDPRLAHAGSAAPGLMALQRSAGNAAVVALVATRPAVQRDVEIDEITTEVGTTGPAPTGGTSGTGGPVTSDGSNTTVSGGTITLAAPLTIASGILRADTIIADSVIASNYTPGTGNVW